MTIAASKRTNGLKPVACKDLRIDAHKGSRRPGGSPCGRKPNTSEAQQSFTRGSQSAQKSKVLSGEVRLFVILGLSREAYCVYQPKVGRDTRKPKS